MNLNEIGKMLGYWLGSTLLLVAVYAGLSHLNALSADLWLVGGIMFLAHVPVKMFLTKLYEESEMKKSDEHRKKVESDIKAIQKIYSEMEYKKYILDLDCPVCKKTSPVEFDLANPEYDCPHCQSPNAVYTQFNVVLISRPVQAK